MQDPKIEAWLTKQGVSWKYVKDVDLDLFDLTRGLKNQARLTRPINEDTVAEYGVAMLDGFEFPAIVSFVAKDGRYVPMDGNHRLRAHGEAKHKRIDTYVVDTDDPIVIDAITRTINVNNGMRPGRAELIQQAVTLVTRDGFTAKAAAERVSVPSEAVQRALRGKKVAQRLETLGEDPSVFTFTELGELGGIPDKVLRPIASLKKDAGLSTTLTQDLAKEIRAKSQAGEDAMLNVVAQWRGRPDIKSRISLTRVGKDRLKGGDRRTNFLTVFHKLRTMVAEAKSLTELQITHPKDVEKLRQEWEEFRGEFQAVLRASK